MTWPLALGIGRDVPGDLGDSLLNMWILGWGLQHVPRLLTGAIGWHDYWNANIFHPDPLALALSEHLFGQTLQMLPVYAVTGNVILCYNLLFIASFALSGLGTYLLVRDLTGDRRAAFLAGLVYGFLPYRIASVPHLQVMSSQWMPFALYGLNRFIAGEASPFDANSAIGSASRGLSRFAPLRPSAKAQGVPSDRWLALAGGTGALVMQNWSCGYYLLYFAPFVPLFCVHRMWTTGRLRQGSLWIGLSAAAAVTLACTLPFLLPYADAQRVFGFERGRGEVVLFSANVWSYVTAAEPVRLWGRALRFYPHGEGETFLGFVPWLLSIVACVVALQAARRQSGESSSRGWRRAATWILAVAVAVQLVAVLSAVIFGGFDSSLFGIPLRARTPVRLIAQLVVATALLVLISPAARRVAASLSRSSAMFFLAITILAMWLSLGPEPSAGDQLVSGVGLYSVLYNYVPGFNGVRVPARYAMIAGLFLAVLAGFGAKAIVARRGSLALVGLLAVLILMEGAAVPMEMNRTWNQNEAVPPAQVFPADRAPCRLSAFEVDGPGNGCHGIPLWRRRVGDPLRLLRRGALEADHQRLQRSVSSGLHVPCRAPSTTVKRSCGRVAGLEGDGNDTCGLSPIGVRQWRRRRARAGVAGRSRRQNYGDVFGWRRALRRTIDSGFYASRSAFLPRDRARPLERTGSLPEAPDSAR